MYLLRATLEDGREFLADVDGRDIRRWEATSRESFLVSTTYSQLHDLAWIALNRTRQLDMPKAEFDLRCVLVKEEPDREPADPTNQAPTAEESSHSL